VTGVWCFCFFLKTGEYFFFVLRFRRRFPKMGPSEEFFPVPLRKRCSPSKEKVPLKERTFPAADRISFFDDCLLQPPTPLTSEASPCRKTRPTGRSFPLPPEDPSLCMGFDCEKDLLFRVSRLRQPRRRFSADVPSSIKKLPLSLFVPCRNFPLPSYRLSRPLSSSR